MNDNLIFCKICDKHVYKNIRKKIEYGDAYKAEDFVTIEDGMKKIILNNCLLVCPNCHFNLMSEVILSYRKLLHRI